MRYRRAKVKGGTYFFTVVTYNRIKIFRDPQIIQLLRLAIKKTKKALMKLGCFAPSGMIHIRPMGASVHYSGTIPMASANGTYSTTANCQSHDFENLYFVDGTTFPFLPAKNLTFTLMANAVRIAENAF